MAKISSQCQLIVRFLYSIRGQLTLATARRAAEALIISRIDYGLLMCIGAPKSMLGILRKTLNSACRLVHQLPYGSHTSSYLHSLSWLPIPARIDFKVAMLVHKVALGLALQYLLELFTAANDIPTRSAKSFFEPASIGTTNWYSKSFAFYGSRLYNGLPPKMRDCQSIASFKKQLKPHLMAKSFDSSLSLTEYATV